MCSPVEHYVCCYLIFLLFKIEDVPGKMGFGVVPTKTIIEVPGKVVYLHYTVYCACLSVVLVAFRFGKYLAGLLPCWGKASHSAARVCCRKMFCYVLCIFFPTWCLCRDFKFNHINSWSLCSYFTSIFGVPCVKTVSLFSQIHNQTVNDL